jgi:predicted house-cleaning noncanonical NTP pyrophosphatase (MazG superfamily)
MITYNKLIRDRIPNIMNDAGKKFRIRKLTDYEYKVELQKKIHEELSEYLNTENNREAIEELADIMEVIYGLCKVHGFSPEELEQVRKEKVEKRGAFQERFFLIDVDE